MVGMARDEPSERAGSLQSLCWGSRVRSGTHIFSTYVKHHISCDTLVLMD